MYKFFFLLAQDLLIIFTYPFIFNFIESIFGLHSIFLRTIFEKYIRSEKFCNLTSFYLQKIGN